MYLQVASKSGTATGRHSRSRLVHQPGSHLHRRTTAASMQVSVCFYSYRRCLHQAAIMRTPKRRAPVHSQTQPPGCSSQSPCPLEGPRSVHDRLPRQIVRLWYSAIHSKSAIQARGGDGFLTSPVRRSRVNCHHVKRTTLGGGRLEVIQHYAKGVICPYHSLLTIHTYALWLNQYSLIRTKPWCAGCISFPTPLLVSLYAEDLSLVGQGVWLLCQD